MRNHALTLAVASLFCLSAGTLSYADNRTGQLSGDPAAQNTTPATPGSGTSSVSGTDRTRTDTDRLGTHTGDSDSQMQQTLMKIAQDPNTAPDKLFALGTAAGNMWEVEFARLAQEKAQDPQVKELARMIEQDHQAANQQLMQWAQQNNLDLPKSLPAEKQAKLSILRALPADKFETCYVIDMKADHAKDITSFRDHAKTLQDPALKQWTQQTLTKLEQHGQHVLQVAQAKNLGDAAWIPGQNNPAMGMNNGNRTGTASDSGNSGTASGRTPNDQGTGSPSPGVGTATPDDTGRTAGAGDK
ncbi:MAG: DUF4142 domain-containing protein [Tepidisphaeraceae bacterium]